MTHPDDGLRDRLLGEHAPAPDKLARHRTETQAMLEREDRRLRLAARFTAGMWIVVVLMGTGFTLAAAAAADRPPKVYFSLGLMMTMLMFGGAVQLVSVAVGRARLELARDVKGLEVRILELEALIRAGRAAETPPPGPG